jgi:prophage regulatory protein
MAMVDFEQMQQQLFMLISEIKALRHDVAEIKSSLMPNVPTLPPDEGLWLTKKQVCDLVKFSSSHIDRLEVAGRFPKRIKIGDNWRSRVMWLRQDVIVWMRAKTSVMMNSKDE